jgi:hypothetical protein
MTRSSPAAIAAQNPGRQGGVATPLRIGQQVADLGDRQRRHHSPRPVLAQEPHAAGVVTAGLVEGGGQRAGVAQDHAGAALPASSRSACVRYLPGLRPRAAGPCREPARAGRCSGRLLLRGHVTAHTRSVGRRPREDAEEVRGAVPGPVKCAAPGGVAGGCKAAARRSWGTILAVSWDAIVRRCPGCDDQLTWATAARRGLRLRWWLQRRGPACS